MSKKIQYSIRAKSTVMVKLRKLAGKKGMTIGNALEYLIDNQQKQIDYFDFHKIENDLQKIKDKLDIE